MPNRGGYFGKEVSMYLIGKVVKVIDDQSVAWEPVALRLTKRGAEKACKTVEYFFVRSALGEFKPEATPTFPRRIKE